MALHVKDIAAAAKKWVRNAAAGATSYVEGVQTTPVDQAAAAIAAKDQYAAGVQAAIGRDAFAKGLREAGTDKWRRGAIEKGASRFPQGVQVSEPLYASATGRFFDIIRNLTLNPRGPTGAPQNYDRSRAVGQALRAAKTGGK